MTDRIDYANNARERVAMAIDAPQTEHEVPALVIAQIATAEATLALVEQQRIANLIAWLGQQPNHGLNAATPDAVIAARREVREGLGL